MCQTLLKDVGSALKELLVFGRRADMKQIHMFPCEVQGTEKVCNRGRTWTYTPPPRRRNCTCKEPRNEGMGSPLNAGACGQSTEGTWWEVQPEEWGWGPRVLKKSDVIRLTFLLFQLLFIRSVYSVALQPPSSTLPSLFSWHWFVGEGTSSSTTSRIWLVASVWCHLTCSTCSSYFLSMRNAV